MWKRLIQLPYCKVLRSNDVGALRTRAIALTSQLSGATAVEQAFDAAFPRPASGETPLTAALSYTLCSRSVVPFSWPLMFEIV